MLFGKSIAIEDLHVLGPHVGQSAANVLQRIEGKAPPTFADALAYTQASMDAARAFVRDRQLATLYPEDVLLVKETPAFLTPSARTAG